MNVDENWRLHALALDKVGVMSWREISRTLGVSKSTCSDFLRAYKEVVDAPITVPAKKQEYDNSRILFLSDMHIPYHNKNLLPFLAGLKERYKPTRVICIGDELDHHATSFHDSDPDLYSAGDELQRALPVIKELEKMFPEVDLVDSNHSSMIYRKSKHHGIPRSYIKSYNEVMQVGEGWKWHHDLTIELPNGESVYIHHGKSGDGLKLSQTSGLSCVQGHFHEKFNISHWANSRGLYFSMQIGCLVDDKSYAFAYNNVNLKRPIIGTGLIIDGKPVLEPMVL